MDCLTGPLDQSLGLWVQLGSCCDAEANLPPNLKIPGPHVSWAVWYMTNTLRAVLLFTAHVALLFLTLSLTLSLTLVLVTVKKLFLGHNRYLSLVFVCLLKQYGFWLNSIFTVACIYHYTVSYCKCICFWSL